MTITKAREQSEREIADEIKKRNAALRQRVMEDRLRRAGIPERFKDRTFDSFTAETEKQERALSTASLYAERFSAIRERGCCLLMLGNVGTGKTHLATAILRSVIDSGYTGLYIRVTDVLRLMRSAFNRSDVTEQEILDTITGVDLLVLDEVGVAIGDGEKRQAMLYDVLDTRYADKKPSVLLANMTASDMESYLGRRLYDRLMEDGGVALEFTWGSHRRVGNEQ